jgi:adenosylcobinamide kinase/adenosylcobinamide-phosphate guanylyltransferase
MARIVLVAGGCRSGKSAYAQELGQSLAPSRAYIATCPVTDDEMRRRIEKHQQAREGHGWVTIEEQFDLAGVFRRCAEHRVVLVDCVTLWVNNLMYHAAEQGVQIQEPDIADRCRELLDAARAYRGTLILVTNEVGLSVVPENEQARRFRDLVGRANQILAAEADTVTFMVCGIPWKLKETAKQ